MRTDTSLDIKDLLEENIKLSKAVLASTEKTRKYMRWMRVMSFVRILLIAIPLVLAVLYIPPFLGKLSEIFGNLYGGEQFNIVNQLKNTAGSGLNDVKNLLNNQK